MQCILCLVLWQSKVVENVSIHGSFFRYLSTYTHASGTLLLSTSLFTPTSTLFLNPLPQIVSMLCAVLLGQLSVLVLAALLEFLLDTYVFRTLLRANK